MATKAKTAEQEANDADVKSAKKGDLVVTLIVDHKPFCRGDILNVTQLNAQGYELDLRKSEYLKGEVAFADLPAQEAEDEDED